jgi:hypothetical protein
MGMLGALIAIPVAEILRIVIGELLGSRSSKAATRATASPAREPASVA